MPLAGRTDSSPPFARRSRNRFLAAGGTERDPKETSVDALADDRTRGLGRERRAGLTRDEEVRLLDEISGQGSQVVELLRRRPRPPRH